MHRCSIALALSLSLSLLVACGGGGSNPDAQSGTPDGMPAIDGPAVADARPDAVVADADTTDADTTDASPPDAGVPDAVPGPDATTVCFGDLCLNITPIDAAVPPPGRLAGAWIDPFGGLPPEIAYDVAWPADQVTSVSMSAFSAPSAGYQFDPGICAGVLFSFGSVIVSTDPDNSGSISSTEFAAEDGTVYGITQAIIAHATGDCAPSPPDFPEGFPAGTHVYTIDTPVHRLDGELVEFQTCAPGTPACANLNNPF